MKNKNKLSVTVAIAVYNSERNLSLLLEALLSQKVTEFSFKEILVYSDCSTDKSNSIAATYAKSHSIVKYQVGTNRLGFAGVIKHLFKINTSNILVVLNDDIFIRDNKFLNSLLSPFKNQKVGFVTGNPIPLPPTNFVQKAANSSFCAFYKMRNSLKNKNNKFTCDGKVMAFSNDFIKNIPLSVSTKMGNVDSYLYFATITSKYTYKHVRYAKVYYMNPSTNKDYLKWQIRNNSNQHILKDSFGDIVSREYKQIKTIWVYKFIEFVKHPFLGTYLLILGFIVKYKSQIYALNFNPMWESLKSTKN
ncbi:glycosyltransferase family 2 protein [Candidatus Woesebacteria bacterium]|nr:MAG: glycosyltransferase family 2 protein [Candidatus Woesebacteria bacterium]